MASKLRFEDCFWVAEFCSTKGFDVLDKHLKEGSDMLKDVIEHIKQRAKIEEDYSKNLIKLAKSSGGYTEIGTMRAAWDCIKNETEQIAQEHKILSNNFSQQALTLTKFREKYKTSRKQAKDKVEKSAKRKADYYTKVLDQRKAYENKCQELQDCISKASMQSGNLEKFSQLQAKQDKLQQEATRLEETYQKLINQLEEARQTWEREMIDFCKVAQKSEKERLEYLQNQLWITANFISQTCVKDDEHCENIRMSLELCDFEADISMFIRKRATGTNRPPPVPYVPDKYSPTKRQHHPHH